MMKAVIMAGGEGSRLRPLTCDTPKPMTRLLGRPVLEYILRLLEQNGVTHAAVTLGYLPDPITQYLAERGGTIETSVFLEPQPLGTAGSVKNACPEQPASVMVISGDAVCDFDLRAAARRFAETQADAMLVVKRVDDPREYGLVDAGPDGMVRGFIEKPSYSQAVTDLANTGVYLLGPRALGLIPDGMKFDFAQDLFPEMLRRGMKLMVYEETGYWCDIGDLMTYRLCQADLLTGQVACDVPGERDPLGSRFLEGRPDGRYQLIPPVYIGRNVSIGDGARIGPYTVLDDGVSVASHAKVRRSILLPGAHIGVRAALTGAVVCPGAVVRENATLFEGSTVGSRAVIGECACVEPGIGIWPLKSAPAHTSVGENIRYAFAARASFDDDGLCGETGMQITPEICAQVGAAIGSAFAGRTIGVGCADTLSGAALKSALISGLLSTGAPVLDFGSLCRAQMNFAMSFCSARTGIYLDSGATTGLMLLAAGGLSAVRRDERAVEGVLARSDYLRCPHERYRRPVDLSGVRILYRTELYRRIPYGLRGMSLQPVSANRELRLLAQEVLADSGCDITAGPVVSLSPCGQRAELFDPDLGHISHARLIAAICRSEFDRGHDVALRADAPFLIDDMAVQAGRRVLRYFECPADNCDDEARRLAENQLWQGDGLMLILSVLDACKREKISLQTLLSRIPSFEIAVKTVTHADNPARMLQTVFAGVSSPAGEGVMVRENGVSALLRPLKRGEGIKVIAQAANFEMAMEICDKLEARLKST